MKVKEQIELYGVDGLSNQQLLEILVQNAQKVPDLLNQGEFTETPDVFRIASMDVKELQYLGLTALEAGRVAAAFELGKRMAAAQYMYRQVKFGSASEAAEYLMPEMQYLTREVFTVILLNLKNRVICSKTLTTGTLSQTSIDQRAVFKYAVVNNAAGIILAHNHPSGDAEPSSVDKYLTKMLVAAGKIVGIPIVDHIVIGRGSYYSFAENKEI